MMTFAVVKSRALCGMYAPLVEVEVHLANGLPQFNIVGLPDTEVKESRDRVRAAIVQSGFEFPTKKITVNLAPADLPKESGRFDLPIAIGILAASGQVLSEQLNDYEFAGELALSGALRPIRGDLVMVWQAKQDKRAFILPMLNAKQVAMMHDVEVYGADSLAQVAAHLNQITMLTREVCPVIETLHDALLPDLKDVKGQFAARLALEVAASGGHSLLMMGPPGTGKSMLAQRLPSILPPLTDDEWMEVWSIYSLLPLSTQKLIGRRRPYKSPHHSASAVALVGGGSDPKPGEISLAHKGVLFLDELPEFDRKVLEALREPLESGEIHISRAARQAIFPADFQLIAAMNPCPCGYYGHSTQSCRCTPEAILRYRNKISGPLLDRLDLVIEVPSLSAEDLIQFQAGEDSSVVLQRVIASREKQYQRQGKVNAKLSPTDLDGVARISEQAKSSLAQMLEKLSLSARSFHRVLRVARTLADLADDEVVERHHVVRAIGLRRNV